jgi:hypothetical protein
VESESSGRENVPIVECVEEMFDETCARCKGEKITSLCPTSFLNDKHED